MITILLIIVFAIILVITMVIITKLMLILLNIVVYAHLRYFRINTPQEYFIYNNFYKNINGTFTIFIFTLSIIVI